MRNKILELLCVYFMELDIFEKFYYRWNINGTNEMNQNIQNGTISELHTDDKK